MVARRSAPRAIASARYTSPHLERLEERFVIDGREVVDCGPRGAAATVQTAVERLVARWHARSAADVLRVRDRDRVRAVPPRRASRSRCSRSASAAGSTPPTSSRRSPRPSRRSTSITRHLLGETLESIAREKAGVIKPGIPVVVGPVAPDAHAVIAERAASAGASSFTLPIASASPTRDRRVALAATVTLDGRCTSPRGRHAGAAGTHQIDNAAVAFCLLDELVASWRARSTAQAMRAGLTERALAGPARATFDGAAPRCMLDAAHNPAGARRSPPICASATGGRDARLRRDARQGRRRHARGAAARAAARSICTTAPSPRALDADALAALASAVATG